MCHDPFGATRIIAAPYITMPSYNYKLDEIGYGRPGERERDLAVEPGRTPPMPRRNVAAIDILMRFHFFPFPPPAVSDDETTDAFFLPVPVYCMARASHAVVANWRLSKRIRREFK
jgi:hypothetical protein